MKKGNGSKGNGKDAGQAGKQEGMARADRHADEHWKACMMEAGKIVALGKPVLTIDDIVLVCRQLHPNAYTHEYRARGPLMASLAREGYIAPTEEFRPSSQPLCHATPRRVWVSLIYKGPIKIAKPRRRRLPDPRQLSLWTAP